MLEQAGAEEDDAEFVEMESPTSAKSLKRPADDDNGEQVSKKIKA